MTWTEQDIPDQHGRVAVVTGATSGIGYDTARLLAARGAWVVLAIRDLEKGKQAVARITESVPGADLSVTRLDLTSLESVRAAAAELRAAHDGIDLLINNAGVMYPPQRTLTADGFELQLGTNHLGHFALTGLVLDRLTARPGSRVVTVSSVGHRIRARIHLDDLQLERSYDRVAAYGQSKLANLMFTYELQRRLTAAGTTTIAVAAHPGFADTDLGRHFPGPIRMAMPLLSALFTQPAARGALPTLRAATDPGVLGGQYYGPSGPFESRGAPRVVSSSAASHDVTVQQQLWTESEKLTGVTFQIGPAGHTV